MRKILGAAVVAVALLTAGLVDAGTASAGAEHCPSTYACFWVGNSYTGTMGKVSGNNKDFRDLYNSHGCSRVPRTWDDCARSIANRGTQCTVYFWTGEDYTGRYHSLGRGDEVPDFELPPPTGYSDPAFNEAISSNHWCTPR